MKQPLEVVAAGFRFLLVAAVGPLLLALFGAIFTFVALVASEGKFFGGELRALAFLLAFILAAATTFGLFESIGSFLCLAVPPESRASEIVVASLLLQLFALVLQALRSVIIFTPSLLGWQDTLVWVQLSAVILGKCLFLWFVYRLGIYLNRPDLSRAAWQTPVRILGLIAALGAMFFFILLIPQEFAHGEEYQHPLDRIPMWLNATIGGLGLLALLLALLIYFRYLGLLWRGNTACRAAL